MKRLSRLSNRQLLGGALYCLGVGLSVLLAVVGGGSEPASEATDAVLVILIVLANGGAAWSFSGQGRADPSHAQQSAARLFLVARRAQVAEARAQRLFEGQATRSELHEAMGILSTEFSWIQDVLILSINDWRVFHADAVSAAEGADEK